MTKLTTADYEQQALALGCETAVLQAFTDVEAGGAGFLPDGRAVLRFEAHKFFSYWGAKHPVEFAKYFKFNPDKKWLGHCFRPENMGWIAYHANPNTEWQAFEFAKSLDEEAAMLSVSLGLFQVCGFNYRGCKNNTVQEWFYDNCESEARQLESAARLMVSMGLTQALRDKNFEVLAAKWNGNGKVADYAPKLRSAYLKRKKQ